ncbi:beta-glucuronidase [Chitinophaga horti]|uniref:beta-galactosidase n=1 Tax=Chitinophaga horti TaxID=2920382 RepID=A0ABY6J8B1_9BACT|nr:sugar-binding domain-containing protein [Chitinophaga horti]UYQ95878.1 beta-glucuronidase [Chitinophaga horti]
MHIYRSLALVALFLVMASFTEDPVIALKGTWSFQTDPENKGIKEQWFSRKLNDQVKLPGSMAENLKGDDITLATKWTGSIYDSSFYFNPRLAKYRQPGNIHFPFWLTPAKHYVGAAWYQREVNIPASWKGKRIVLHLERAHIQTRIWVDDKEVGTQNSLVAPHEYDLSAYMTPGAHRITMRIDNHIDEIKVGPDSHSVTDHTQGNWNGIIGKMQLLATEKVYIETVAVHPDIKQKEAQVKLRIRNASGQAFQSQLIVKANSFNTKTSHVVAPVQVAVNAPANNTADITVTLPMGDNVQLWDEFTPAIYKLTASLTNNGRTLSEKQTDFGMRQINIQGKAMMLNDRRIFLRGTVHNCEFPLTGYPAMDVQAWTNVMKTIKAHGLNHMRFHSWCPPEAAFEAADREGVYLQPEGPSWPNHGPKIGLGQFIDSFLYAETRRIVEAYGNHPSFCMLSAGNEPAGNQVPYLNAFVDYWKARDDRRVYTGMSVGGSWPVVPNAQFQVRGGVRGLAWDARPESRADFSAGIAKFDVPFVAHEIGQYCVFPDFTEIKKYTGVYRAKNFELFRQDLADHGMAAYAKDFLKASGKLQVLAYKTEIEKMLRTPDYGGFQMLGLQDFPGQGTALVGVLNAFWQPKGYVTPQQFSRFCNTVVPLAKLDKFVYTSNDTLAVDVAVANWSAKPLTASVFTWTIKDGRGQILQQGSWQPASIELGNGIPVGSFAWPLAQIKTPTRLTLEVAIKNTPYANDWDIWVYPATVPKVAIDVYYTAEWNDKTKAVLDKGGKVFFNAAGKVVKGKEVAMYFQPVFWNTSWFQMKPPHVTGLLIQDKHKAFANFPTDYHSDLQWWEIAQKSQVMNLEDFPAGFNPIVRPIDTWFLNRPLGLIFEAQVGKGKLVVCSADLHDALPAEKPVARQLYHSLMKYMASADFKPAGNVSYELVNDLLVSPSKIQFNKYTRDSPDELKPNSGQKK